MNSSPINRRIVLAARPKGPATPESFRLEEKPVPALEPGQMLLRTHWLSLDPYMRGRMSDAPSYAAPVEIGAVMTGGTVARVEASRNPQFAIGDWVLSVGGWQEYSISDGVGATKLPAAMAHPSYALGVLGMPGFTAYRGLLDIGKPRAGETVVVSAATGAVGSLVGQIAKLHGCRVVGIAGGAEKCAWATDGLGFDACVDHREAALPERLAAACPQGIDVYFESVGGLVLQAVLPLFNVHARMPVCGLIAHYQDTASALPPDFAIALLRTVLVKRLTMRGFIIFDDYGPRFTEFGTQMSAWLAGGAIKYREDVVLGLERAPAAFIGMLSGGNFGKLVVKVAG